MLRNNPVRLLEEERRLIWKDKSPPDIILSIGTGILADNAGATKSGGMAVKIAKTFVPKGLKGKIAVGLDMIRSTLDCDKQWDDFTSAFGREVDLMGACHRLNVGLNDRPPNLDDVAAIPYLKYETERYLHPDHKIYIDKGYRSAHQHIQAIARRLLASLFYLDRGKQSSNKFSGILHCRLSPTMTEQFRRLSQSDLKFRLRQRVKDQGIFVSTINTDFDLRTFSSKIEFEIISKVLVIEVQMARWPIWERISGMAPI
jgi:hypothetical protein